MKRNKIKRLFEVMEKIDSSFKRINENVETSEEITEIILNNPDRINEFDLSKLESSNIYDILTYEPQLIKELQPVLSNLDGDHLLELMIRTPELKDVLKKYAYIISDYHVHYHLLKNPNHVELIDYDIIDKLDGDHIIELVRKYPKLKNSSVIRKKIVDVGLRNKL